MGDGIQDDGYVEATADSDTSGLSSMIQKPPNNMRPYASISSEESSLFSQSSISSLTSLFSSLSRQSQGSIQSQVSVPSSQLSLSSQGSFQSELSLYSQSSLGFLPCLGGFNSHRNWKQGQEYCCISTVQGYNGHVSSLALAGELLYSGTSSNDIRVWLQGGGLTEYCRFGSGKGVVKALAVTKDRIFSAHEDHKIRIWKTASQQQKTVPKLLATLPTLKDQLILSIIPKSYVQTRRHKKHLWIAHIDTISVLAVSRNEDLLYSGSWDRTVKVWRLSDFKCLESHDDAINAIAISDEGYVYTASADAKVKVWLKATISERKKQKHALITTLESHKSAVNALALNSDGSVLYSAACDRAIIVWEREDSAQHMTATGALRGHKHAVLCMAAVGDIVCSGSADKTVRVWKKESGTAHSCLAVLRGHTAPVKCINVCMGKMGCIIYSGSLDHAVKVWCVVSVSSKQNDTKEEDCWAGLGFADDYWLRNMGN